MIRIRLHGIFLKYRHTFATIIQWSSIFRQKLPMHYTGDPGTLPCNSPLSVHVSNVYNTWLAIERLRIRLQLTAAACDRGVTVYSLVTLTELYGGSSFAWGDSLIAFCNTLCTSRVCDTEHRSQCNYFNIFATSSCVAWLRGSAGTLEELTLNMTIRVHWTRQQAHPHALAPVPGAKWSSKSKSVFPTRVSDE